MTDKEFFNKVANGKNDFLQAFIDIVRKNKIKFCIIGGLGVNAYAEPVVSLDLDVVIVVNRLTELIDILKKEFKTEKHSHSINIYQKDSDFRIQLQTDEYYQQFIDRASEKNVLGYTLPVASIEDIIQGKIKAAMDSSRRQSKRQKDLADIMRLIEVKEELKKLLPEELKDRLYK